MGPSDPKFRNVLSKFESCLGFDRIDCFPIQAKPLIPQLQVCVVVALAIADCYAEKEFLVVHFPKCLTNSFLHLMHRKNSPLSSRFALTFELLIAAAALSSDQIRISAL